MMESEDEWQDNLNLQLILIQGQYALNIPSSFVSVLLSYQEHDDAMSQNFSFLFLSLSHSGTFRPSLKPFASHHLPFIFTP